MTELDYLSNKISAVSLPKELKDKLERWIMRLKTLAQSGVAVPLLEIDTLNKYVDWVISIPFGKFSQDNLNLQLVKQELDGSHFGLTAVKGRLQEYVATRILKYNQNQRELAANPLYINNSAGRSPILCFVGVQGVGKTTMAKSMAKALGRKFERIALGAFADVAEIRGRSKAEPGAEPGQLVKALIRAQTMNPIILLDEIDKVSESSGLKMDIMAALLEILDPEQNSSFTDRYLDFPIDLSQIIFITTANNLTTISQALLDRMETIRFSSYSDEEKVQIAKVYLMPKVLKDSGLEPGQIKFSDDVWPIVVRPLGFDPGIRELERTLRSLMAKFAKLVVEGYQGELTLTPENFREFIPEQIVVNS